MTPEPIRDARCTFCDAVVRTRFNQSFGQWVFAQHGGGKTPCPGSNSFVPPGAFIDQEAPDADQDTD